MSLVHAFDLLTGPAGTHDVSIAALFGNDATLRGWVASALAGEGDVTVVDGESARWSDLRDDLATASLFDLDGRRTIVVRGADKFVSDHRPQLEKYIGHGGSESRLVLDLDSLASNTRVYKGLLKDGLLVACSASNDSKLGVTASTRRSFLTSFVAARHQTRLDNSAADALVEMMGDCIGMLDTEIAKLALYVPPNAAIDESLVRDVVAGWQGKTVWQITDAIAAGNAGEAIRQLDKLMSGGQRPIALLPQIAWSLRRLGMATAVVEQRERTGRRWSLEEALSTAGIHRPGDAKRAASQLKGIGRERGRQLLPWLLDADLRLKGTHSAEGRDRFLLEQLVIKLSSSAET